MKEKIKKVLFPVVFIILYEVLVTAILVYLLAFIFAFLEQHPVLYGFLNFTHMSWITSGVTAAILMTLFVLAGYLPGAITRKIIMDDPGKISIGICIAFAVICGLLAIRNILASHEGYSFIWYNLVLIFAVIGSLG